jgi:hypothetical protein
MGDVVAEWLRNTSSRKVPGLRPDEVNGFNLFI